MLSLRSVHQTWAGPGTESIFNPSDCAPSPRSRQRGHLDLSAVDIEQPRAKTHERLLDQIERPECRGEGADEIERPALQQVRRCRREEQLLPEIQTVGKNPDVHEWG